MYVPYFSQGQRHENWEFSQEVVLLIFDWNINRLYFKLKVLSNEMDPAEIRFIKKDLF